MPSEREDIIRAFLGDAGWGTATRAPLAGDASTRRYERLTDGPAGASAMLMDAADTVAQLDPFVRIARHLTQLDLSAPRILATDMPHGLLLIEDLGDALFARLLDTDPAREAELYLAATDVLTNLHAHPAPDAPDYGPTAMVAATDLAHDWYGFGTMGAPDRAGKTAMQSALATAIRALPQWTPVLALRDFHAENLFWLPDRTGAARVGLIDFQDAVLCHPAYDLVSLSRDVRRDVAPETGEVMLTRYATATGQDRAALSQAAATLAAQRNLRILGIFARLSLRFGKARYVDFIPRTWSLLMDDLTHPALHDLKATVTTSLPAPTPDILARLKDTCSTAPHL